MSLTTMSTLLVLLVVLSVGYAALRLKPSRAYVRWRRGAPGLWERLYPTDQQAIVRAILEEICDAFLLRKGDISRLRPTDKLIDIYRAAYSDGDADTLELETLAQVLVDEFSLSSDRVASIAQATVADVLSWGIEARAAQATTGGPASA